MSEASEKHHIACSIELQDIMVFVTSTVIDKAKQHKNLLTKDSMKDGKSAIVAERCCVQLVSERKISAFTKLIT